MVGQIQAATDLKAQWQSLVGAPQPAHQTVVSTPSAIRQVTTDAIAGIVDTREPRLTHQIELLEYQLDQVAFLRRQVQRQCRFIAAVDAARALSRQ